jgi:hypothetical protein
MSQSETVCQSLRILSVERKDKRVSMITSVKSVKMVEQCRPLGVDHPKTFEHNELTAQQRFQNRIHPESLQTGSNQQRTLCKSTNIVPLTALACFHKIAGVRTQEIIPPIVAWSFLLRVSV